MRAKVALGLVRTAESDARRRQRARHTAAEWTKIIAAQRRSELTIMEFCRRRDIALATFGYWRRRLVQPAAVAPPVQRFLAVPLVAPVAAPIEVDLGTLRVRLEGGAAARVIDAIIARIGGEATR
jgi:hypothetical protein